ncbi:hypothetical protein MesoLjLb_23460 [Mesorhizobium sp. L-8-3]|nr:hypothetical protein MesoLjLb_23460 [Mesorhizobium sp. L-8-3]
MAPERRTGRLPQQRAKAIRAIHVTKSRAALAKEIALRPRPEPEPVTFQAIGSVVIPGGQMSVNATGTGPESRRLVIVTPRRFSLATDRSGAAVQDLSHKENVS